MTYLFFTSATCSFCQFGDYKIGGKFKKYRTIYKLEAENNLTQTSTIYEVPFDLINDKCSFFRKYMKVHLKN